jgi:hypothetical protein
MLLTKLVVRTDNHLTLVAALGAGMNREDADTGHLPVSQHEAARLVKQPEAFPVVKTPGDARPEQKPWNVRVRDAETEEKCQPLHLRKATSSWTATSLETVQLFQRVLLVQSSLKLGFLLSQRVATSIEGERKGASSEQFETGSQGVQLEPTLDF